MDLALLVYAISLIGDLKYFVVLVSFALAITVAVTGIYTASWYFGGYEYSWDLKRDGTLKDQIQKSRDSFKNIFTKSIPWLALSVFVGFIIPSEKTAYTMVGAYAAQKIAQDDRTVEVSGKVLTIINQKLDSFVEAGIEEAEARATKAIKGETKKDKKDE